MDEEKKINVDDYMVDGFGRLVPKENVSEIDKIRDELVRDLAGQAQKIQEEMIKFKQKAYSTVSAFVELSAAEYGRKYGGKKGNVKLHSFDHSRMIHIQISALMNGWTWQKNWLMNALIDGRLKEKRKFEPS